MNFEYLKATIDEKKEVQEMMERLLPTKEAGEIMEIFSRPPSFSKEENANIMVGCLYSILCRKQVLMEIVSD